MALWDGTTLNNNLLASTVNQLHKDGRLINQVANNYPYLYAIMGKAMPDGTKLGGLKFQNVKRTGGKAIQIRLAGQNSKPAVVARGSAELATSTATAFNVAGAVTFQTAPYQNKQYIPGSEIEEIRGNEALTKNWVREYYELMLDGTFAQVEADLLGTALPSASALGGLYALISDGTTSGETGYDNYGITRSATGNAFWKSTVATSAGSITWQKVSGYQVATEAGTGMIDLGVWNPVQYNALKTQIEGLTMVEQDDHFSRLGARHFWYSGMHNIADSNVTAGTSFLLDSSTIALYWNDVYPLTEGLKEDPSKVNAYYLKMRMYLQHLVDKPRANVKILGWTA